MATSRGMLALLCAFFVFGVILWPADAWSQSDTCVVAATMGEPGDEALLAALEGQEPPVTDDVTAGTIECTELPALADNLGQVDILADAGTTGAVNPLATPAAADQPQPADSTATAIVPMRFVRMPDIAREWKYLGGDPAGIPLDEQIQHMQAPDSVRNVWAQQVAHETPTTISIPRGTLVYELAFGGRTNRIFKTWPRATCAWREKKTGSLIESAEALVYPIVWYRGSGYRLIQFTACTNSAYLLEVPIPAKGEIPPPEEPPTEPPVAETPPDSLPPPPKEPPTAETPPDEIPFEPADAANIVVNGTAWLTGEYVDGKNGGDHLNGFSGTEIIVRKSYSDHNLGLVLRAGGGAIGQPDANGSFQTAGGLLRAGLRLPLKDPSEWGFAAEAGGYADAQKLVWRDERYLTPTYIHWQERRNTVSDAGGYLRTVGYGPRTLVWDARAATGKRVKHEIEASASGSPRPRIQVRAGFRESEYRDRTVSGPDREFTFPHSSFRTVEGFVGYRPKLNHVVSVGWKEWKYHSPIWEFDWAGPAIAYDWKINMPWRFRADVTRFSDTEEHDPRTGKSETNDHTRATLGVNYDF